MAMKVVNQFTPRLTKVIKSHKQVTHRALSEAALGLHGDVIQLDPKPPVDTGHLRDSIGAVVGSDQLTSDSGQGRKFSKPDTAVIYGDTPYANRMHELGSDISIRYKTHKKPAANVDSGRFFIISKLVRYHKKYIEQMADGVRKGLASVW